MAGIPYAPSYTKEIFIPENAAFRIEVCKAAASINDLLHGWAGLDNTQKRILICSCGRDCSVLTKTSGEALVVSKPCACTSACMAPSTYVCQSPSCTWHSVNEPGSRVVSASRGTPSGSLSTEGEDDEDEEEEGGGMGVKGRLGRVMPATIAPTLSARRSTPEKSKK